MRKLIWLSLSFLLLTTYAIAQTRTISGTVTDEKGNGLANSSIVVKGTNIGVSTGPDGSFTLSVPSSASSIVVSYVGLADKEITLTNSNSYTIILSPTSKGSMDEVVVVAYGTTQRRKVTGSVTKVGGNEVENVPMSSVDKMLQGKVAGLQSVAATGQPGSAQQIRIRGIGSISASSSPLFVIDGVPVNSGDFSGATNSSNLLAGLNPNDIESISVLKDAASASIYGSRAANGVIVITTKRGKAGKTKIRVDGEVGSNDIAYFPDLAKPLNKDEFKQLTTEGILHPQVGGTQADVDYFLDLFGYNTTADYNWLNLVKRRGQQQQYNVSASGGDTKTQFFLSGGYFKQVSEIIGSDFKRYSVNTNVRHQAGKRLTLGANLNMSSFHQEGESESSNFRNPIIAALALLPTQEAYNPDGSPNYDPAVFDQIFNPLAIRKYDRLSNQTSKLLGSVNAEFAILDNLKLTSRYGIDYSNIEEYSYYNPLFGDYSTSDPATTGLFYNRYNRLFNWVWTNLADYDFRTMQSKLSGHLTVGYEAQKSQQLTQDATGVGLPATSSVSYPTPITPKPSTYSGSDYSFVSLLSKAEFSFLNRYTLTGSLRRDGSSRFGVNNRFGTFWSVGAAWNIDQENFMQNLDVISLLKLRGSYGVNGNAGIGNYGWRTVYSFTGTYNSGTASFPQTADNAVSSDNSNLGNPNLTWERNKPLDVGLEIGVLKNRITLEADWYKRKTDELLLSEPLSLTSGFPSVSNNIGALENKGVELTLDVNPVKTKDFNWTVSLNAAWNRNKVTRLREGQTEIRNLPYIIRVGEDIQSIFTRMWAGADPQTGDPLWYKDDTRKETTSDFSQAQRAIVGSASPKGFGGFSTALTYKFITLDAQLNYQYGNLLYDQWGFLFTGDGAFASLNHNRKQLQRWQKPGDVTDVPRYDFFNSTSSNAVSTRYFYKGDYIRLRNISLGFNLPSSVINRLKLSAVNIYVRGTNLWTKAFDKNITMDPEQGINGQNDLQFFIPKSMTVGLSVQL
jgi:TonB-linked SusC/RagA family outer membrane protein